MPPPPPKKLMMMNPSFGKTTTTSPPLSVSSEFTINFAQSGIQKNFLISTQANMLSTEPPKMNGHTDPTTVAAHSTTNGILKNSPEKKWIVQ